MSKIIKDSVHGYIEVEDLFVPIINSAEFQRLKNIEQGSYRVLYPAARHDRFIHSLGVYYLATIFSEHFLKNIVTDLSIEADFANETIMFRYAALLHDFGHAPFSHTTEDFFSINRNQANELKINIDLFEAVSSYYDKIELPQNEIERRIKAFKSDFAESDPKPHEIISSTLLIRKAFDFFSVMQLKSFDLELAARMVIGCTYSYDNLSSEDIKKYGIRNCFIRLLNSKTVDIDKLDYIKRDNMMTGFNNVIIDIPRLAQSVTAHKSKDGIYPAFRKSALSVIDNVFRAKEEQGNWIISHPIVLYDSGILSSAITSLFNKDQLKRVFSIDSLGVEGSLIDDERRFSLLNDSDIIPLLKQKADFSKANLFAQVFDRNIRLKPIWKSKVEYSLLFGNEGERFYEYFISAIKYLINNDFILNDESYQKIVLDNQINEELKEVFTTLKDFSRENSINFEYAFSLPKPSFAPSFDPSMVFIRFSKIPCDKEVYTYTDLNRLHESKKINYFYMYSKDKFSGNQLKILKENVRVHNSENINAVCDTGFHLSISPLCFRNILFMFKKPFFSEQFSLHI